MPTGSKPAGSFTGNGFTAEIWLFDSVPSIDVNNWRLDVGAQRLTFDELLTRYPRREVQAVLDCTSGWWSEQVWSGVSVRDVLAAADLGSSNVAFTSVTGHRIVLSTDELRDAILATQVGGETISAGHGYPVRLVVPGFRGYHWVKWLASVTAA